MQTIANITQTQISSIDEFLEKYTEIEAKMPTFPIDSNTLRQQLKQALPQIQEVYNGLKVSEYDTISDENLLIEFKKLSAEMIIKDTKHHFLPSLIALSANPVRFPFLQHSHSA